MYSCRSSLIHCLYWSCYPSTGHAATSWGGATLMQAKIDQTWSSKTPRTLHMKLQKKWLSPIQTTTFFHNCNDFHNDFFWKIVVKIFVVCMCKGLKAAKYLFHWWLIIIASITSFARTTFLVYSAPVLLTVLIIKISPDIPMIQCLLRKQ